VQIIAAARLVYPTPATGAPLPEEQMVPLTSPASLSKTTSKTLAADIHPPKATKTPKIVVPSPDTSYCRYLGSLVTKLHREVALPQLIADCGKAIVENAANQTGWNYMMISVAANWALNGMSNTTTQLAFIGLQLCMVPLFVILMRILVVLTPKCHIPFQPAVGQPTTQEFIDQRMKNVPNRQDADKWFSEIHLPRDHPELHVFVRAREGYSHDEIWAIDRKSYIPPALFWGLSLYILWTSEIAKQNLLYVAFFIDHLGTAGHAWIDTHIAGLWHHVSTRDEFTGVGFCKMLIGLVLKDAIAYTSPAAMALYCCGIQFLPSQVGFVFFVFILSGMMTLTNHYFHHGRSQQRLPKLIRKYIFKGFLWKYNILVDDMFHKTHHFDAPEEYYALMAGFMDKLFNKVKNAQTLYIHNPKLNRRVEIIYFALSAFLFVRSIV
jgi:hypothetical protein